MKLSASIRAGRTGLPKKANSYKPSATRKSSKENRYEHKPFKLKGLRP